MVKLNKIYTRTGDEGLTSLADGSRVPKDNLRVEAYGTLDEANSFIGVARLYADNVEYDLLAKIQNTLFDIGAELAQPNKKKSGSRVTQSQIDELENEIDRYNLKLQPLNSFILPGGTYSAAHLHVARSIVRRSERLSVAISNLEKIDPLIIVYLNRLSDYLFVLARHQNNDGSNDVLWVPRGN